MGRGKASGHSLSTRDASVVLGMIKRGDREHDIAAWFGVNQGRIAEVKKGDYGTLSPAPAQELLPSGSPGIKLRCLKASVDRAVEKLQDQSNLDAAGALQILLDAVKRYETPE